MFLFLVSSKISGLKVFFLLNILSEDLFFDLKLFFTAYRCNQNKLFDLRLVVKTFLGSSLIYSDSFIPTAPCKFSDFFKMTHRKQKKGLTLVHVKVSWVKVRNFFVA